MESFSDRIYEVHSEAYDFLVSVLKENKEVYVWESEIAGLYSRRANYAAVEKIFLSDTGELSCKMYHTDGAYDLEDAECLIPIADYVLNLVESQGGKVLDTHPRPTPFEQMMADVKMYPDVLVFADRKGGVAEDSEFWILVLRDDCTVIFEHTFGRTGSKSMTKCVSVREAKKNLQFRKKAIECLTSNGEGHDKDTVLRWLDTDACDLGKDEHGEQLVTPVDLGYWLREWALYDCQLNCIDRKEYDY